MLQFLKKLVFERLLAPQLLIVWEHCLLVFVLVIEQAKEDRVEDDQKRHHSIKPRPLVQPDAQLSEEIAEG